VAEYAVSKFPPNWRPNSWTNSVSVCLSTGAVFSFHARQSQGRRLARGQQAGRQADVIDPLGPQGRGRDRRVMRGPTTHPPTHQSVAGWSGQGQPGDCASFTSTTTQDIPPGGLEFTPRETSLACFPHNLGFSLLLLAVAEAYLREPGQRQWSGASLMPL
jgi:hypothetical protein